MKPIVKMEIILGVANFAVAFLGDWTLMSKINISIAFFLFTLAFLTYRMEKKNERTTTH